MGQRPTLARPRKAAACLLFAGGALAHAAGSRTSTAASASVSIRKAIAVTRQRNLDFGGLVIGGAPGAATATLDPRTNALTFSGASIIGTFNTHSRAQFRVTGTRNATYAVLLPASLNLTGSNGGTLQLSPLSFWSTTAASGSAGALANNGRDTLRVGGTLGLPNGVADGDYTGTFNVTVAYN